MSSASTLFLGERQMPYDKYSLVNWEVLNCKNLADVLIEWPRTEVQSALRELAQNAGEEAAQSPNNGKVERFAVAIALHHRAIRDCTGLDTLISVAKERAAEHKRLLHHQKTHEDSLKARLDSLCFDLTRLQRFVKERTGQQRPTVLPPVGQALTQGFFSPKTVAGLRPTFEGSSLHVWLAWLDGVDTLLRIAPWARTQDVSKYEYFAYPATRLEFEEACMTLQPEVEKLVTELSKTTSLQAINEAKSASSSARDEVKQKWMEASNGEFFPETLGNLVLAILEEKKKARAST